MAGGVNTNPEALRSMARELQVMQENVDQALGRLRAALNGAQWNDSNRVAFDQHLESLTSLGKQMQQSAKAGQMLVNVKARQLDAYLGR